MQIRSKVEDIFEWYKIIVLAGSGEPYIQAIQQSNGFVYWTRVCIRETKHQATLASKCKAVLHAMH